MNDLEVDNARKDTTMPPKATREEFIAKAKAKHPGKYNYDLVVYAGNKVKVEIVCLACGEHFWQEAASHSSLGAGCPTCGRKQTAASKKLTQEQFIAKAKAKHPGKYNYDLVVYAGDRVKVEIVCLACKEHFWQAAGGHTGGRGCLNCAGTRLSTRGEFISKAKAKHPGKYNYDRVVYANGKTKVNIICLGCGKDFWQEPNSHTGGKGCSDCGTKRQVQARTHTKDEFIKGAKAKHPRKYNYDLIEYINSGIKVEIVCLACGEHFWQAPAQHTAGKGCSSCAGTRLATREEFIVKSKAIHLEKYGYDLANYLGAHIKVEIVCLACRQHFWQTPSSHINGRSGCPSCKQSKGEMSLIQIFIERKLVHTRQQKYYQYLGQKAFDFHVELSGGQLLLEYDGIQHFEPVGRFGADKGFAMCQASDLAKTCFAIEHKIPLLRLDYTLPLDSLHLHLDAALDALGTYDLLVSDAYLYQPLIDKVLAQLPDARILCLDDSTPVPHPSWYPEEVSAIQAALPDFDLTRPLEELDPDELWSLIELFGHSTLATETSSSQHMLHVLQGQAHGAVAGLRVAMAGSDVDLLRYILAAC